MLGSATVVANIAVSDLTKAKEFYEKTLGLKQIDENPGGVTYQSGEGKLFVYPTPMAGSNKATCATWDVDDIESVVKELNDKGVSFEHYDMPGGQRDGDIHVMGNMKGAWFKDPDGNILGIASVA